MASGSSGLGFGRTVPFRGRDGALRAKILPADSESGVPETEETRAENSDFAATVEFISREVPPFEEVRLEMHGMRPIRLVDAAGGPISNVKSLKLSFSSMTICCEFFQVAELVAGPKTQHLSIVGQNPFRGFRDLPDVFKLKDRTICVDLMARETTTWCHDSDMAMNPFLSHDMIGSALGEALSSSFAKAKKLSISNRRLMQQSRNLSSFHDLNEFTHGIGVLEGASEAFLELSIRNGFGLSEVLPPGARFAAPGKWDYEDFDIHKNLRLHFTFASFGIHLSTIALLALVEAAPTNLQNVTVIGNVHSDEMYPFQLPQDGRSAFRTCAFEALVGYLEERGFRLLDPDQDIRRRSIRRWVTLIDSVKGAPPVLRHSNSSSSTVIFKFVKVEEEEEKAVLASDDEAFPSCLTISFLVRILQCMKVRATDLMMSNEDEAALGFLREARQGLLYAENLEASARGGVVGIAISLNISLCLLRLKKFRDCLMSCRALLRYRKGGMTLVQLAKVHCRMGRCWEAYRKIDKAKACYEAALRVYSDCEVARKRLRALN